TALALLRRRDEELDERVELGARELLLEVLRHHIRLEAGRDLGVRIHDRLADEVGALALQNLIEVRPHLAARARRGKRVTRVASGAREESLALSDAAGRRGHAAGRALLSPNPLPVVGEAHDDRLRPHRRMAEAAELGAD